MPNDDDLLDTREAAEMLGITSESLERWRRKGRGPRWIKVSGEVGRAGGRVAYARSAIREYLDQRTVQPQPLDGPQPYDQPFPELEDGDSRDRE